MNIEIIKIVKPKIKRIRRSKHQNYSCIPKSYEAYLVEKTISVKSGKLTHHAIKINNKYYFNIILDELIKLCEESVIDYISFEYNELLKGIVHNEKNKTYFSIGSFEQVELI